MNKTLEYFIVTGSTPPILDEEVNKKLAQGWKPQGGVGIAVVHQDGDGKCESLMVVQAVVREKQD